MHELVVDECVQQLGDDRQQGDGAVELREGSVFFLEELDDFRQLEGVRVVVLIDGLVEEAVQDWCQERCQVSDDGGFDFEDIAGFIPVDLVHGFGGISLNQTGQAIECMVIVMATYLTISLTISVFMNIYNRSKQFKEK